MPRSNLDMIYKLQVALNAHNMRIILSRQQFFSEEQNRPVTIYKVSQSRATDIRVQHIELFTSASQIQIVLFLRNLWYAYNGNPIPPTNQIKGAEEFENKWDAFSDIELQNCIDYAKSMKSTSD